MQQVTGQSVELVWADEGYTGGLSSHASPPIALTDPRAPSSTRMQEYRTIHEQLMSTTFPQVLSPSRKTVSSHWRRDRPSKLSHINIFLIGWVYYLGLPMAAGYLNLFALVDQAAPFADRFDVRTDRWYALAIYVFLLPACYIGGNWVACKFKSGPFRTGIRPRFSSQILLPIYALLLATFAFQARTLLFGGYVEGYDASLMGPLATIEMVLLYQYIACSAAGLRRYSFAFGFLLFLASVVLLSMGGRIYVASALSAVMFYRWKWVARTRQDRYRMVKWILLAPLAFAAIGMIRLGTFDLTGLGFFLLAEPLFTAISGISFVLDDKWHWFAFPNEFISSFVNIVPSSIWPNKVDQILQLSDIYPEYQSPFGAQSIVVSTIGNFGYVGGLMFVGVVGAFIGRVALKATTPHSCALYCFLVSMLLFIFFRDPYQIQVKLVFTGLVLNLLQRVIDSYPRKSANPPTISVTD